MEGSLVRLLQYTNVATAIGGTGACALSIKKSLPDWEHVVMFRSGKASEETENLFGCPLEASSRMLPRHIEEYQPDVILFHNTPPDAIPNYIRDGIVTCYYQHSAVTSARTARKRCDLIWGVSQHLNNQAGLEFLFYQPCPTPLPIVDFKRDDDLIHVIRFCTPSVNKWRNVVSLYDFLTERHKDVFWHFVGCPKEIQDQLAKACGGQSEFINPSWSSRRLLRHCDVMLYESSLHESYGRVVCEAQRSGCVPIVSKHSGFVEQIEHGTTGFLCEDFDQFDHALRMIKDKPLRSEIAEHAKRSGDSRGMLSTWRRKFINWIKAAVAVA